MTPTEILDLIEQAIREYRFKNKTPIVSVSYDGDHNSGEIIIDVEEYNQHTKDVDKQVFVLSSSGIRESEIEHTEDSEGT